MTKPPAAFSQLCAVLLVCGFAAAVEGSTGILIRLDNCARAGDGEQLEGADYKGFFLAPSGSEDTCGQWVFKSVFKGVWSSLPREFYDKGLSGAQLRQYAEGGFQPGSTITTRSRGACDLSVLNYPVKIKLHSCNSAGGVSGGAEREYRAYYDPRPTGDTTTERCGKWVFQRQFLGRKHWTSLPSEFYDKGLSGAQLRQYAEGGFQPGSTITTPRRPCDLMVLPGDLEVPHCENVGAYGLLGDDEKGMVSIQKEESVAVFDDDDSRDLACLLPGGHQIHILPATRFDSQRAELDIVPGKGFHWWAKGYDALTSAILQVVNNNFLWQILMTTSQDISDREQLGTNYVKVAQYDELGSEYQRRNHLEFLLTRCVSSAMSIARALMGTDPGIWAINNAMDIRQTGCSDPAAGCEGHVLTYDQVSHGDLRSLLRRMDTEARDTGDDYDWLYVFKVIDSRPGVGGANLWHIFTATQRGGPGAHPPVFWQSNFYLMSMASFTRGLPRIRTSLESFGADVRRFMMAPTRGEQRQWSMRLFGGPHPEDVDKLGKFSGFEQAWCADLTGVSTEECLKREGVRDLSFTVHRFKVGHRRAVENLRTTDLRTMPPLQSSIVPSDHYAHYDHERHSCCIARSTRGGDYPSYCMVLPKGDECPRAAPVPLYTLTDFEPFVLDTSVTQATFGEKKWFKELNTPSIEVTGCEFPYDFQDIVDRGQPSGPQAGLALNKYADFGTTRPTLSEYAGAYLCADNALDAKKPLRHSPAVAQPPNRADFETAMPDVNLEAAVPLGGRP